MTVARMHKQRTVRRGYNVRRYTAQKPIKRGGPAVPVQPPPALALETISPSTIVEHSPTAIELVGSGFLESEHAPVFAVIFTGPHPDNLGSSVASDITVVDDTTITFTSTDGTSGVRGPELPGVYDVTIGDGFSGSNVLIDGFTVSPIVP